MHTWNRKKPMAVVVGTLAALFMSLPALGNGSIYKVIDECGRTCSDSCAGIVEALEGKIDEYYASCVDDQGVQPGIGTDRRQPSAPRAVVQQQPTSYVCAASRTFRSSPTSAGRRHGLHDDQKQTNHQGVGNDLATALNAACNSCGGNRTVNTLSFTNTYVCQIAACTDATTGHLLDKSRWQNLIPAKCTNSHNQKY